MTQTIHPSRACFAAIAGAAILGCPTQGSAQSETEIARADSIAQHRVQLMELAHRLSGCFAVTAQSLPDSLRLPDVFELKPDRFTELGYHRLFSFSTDLPPISAGGYPPIWSVASPQTLLLELSPSPVGGSRHELVITLEDESSEFRLEGWFVQPRFSNGEFVADRDYLGWASGSSETCRLARGT